MLAPDLLRRLEEVKNILNIQYEAYTKVKPFADKYLHPHPTDTRAWSQILVSALTGIKGFERKKGPDLADGSDVKGANCWDAIDTPRFNGCIKSGTRADTAGSIESLDGMPYLFLVLWDKSEVSEEHRCRVWVVRTQHDQVFRGIAQEWYRQRESGEITSDNFQLHPPRYKDSNIIRNNCGTLKYPLLLDARLQNGSFEIIEYNPNQLISGVCAHV